MIFDHILHIGAYKGLHPNLDSCIDYLTSHSLVDLDNGQYEIDGKKVFFFLQENQTTPDDSEDFEYHESYIDIHLLKTGRELVRFGVGFEKESLAFDPSKDIGFATCEYSLDMEMDPHHFVLFMPGELHQPNRTISGYERVEKYVFKVLLD